METPTYLANFEAVTAAYGYWPGFHDANVRAFEVRDGSVRLVLHAFEMTSEVDTGGYFVLHKHHLVSFLFEDILEADLSNFIADNILDELGLSSNSEHALNGSVSVRLESALGGDLCGSFTAARGSVTSVHPYSPVEQGMVRS